VSFLCQGRKCVPSVVVVGRVTAFSVDSRERSVVMEEFSLVRDDLFEG